MPLSHAVQGGVSGLTFHLPLLLPFMNMLNQTHLDSTYLLVQFMNEQNKTVI
jgi:hypothetical protein